ncbi:hypothetical protein SAMN05216446_0350 [Parafannyhessea umbonata]|uniref:Uncharacterized protein n=1 Tax=Parafannyhessea umbonata TaxID=604330 RepID=A0A1H9NBE7_9ACTN|nr:hypothetical protein SAMN05216446_0350 [Parafannyhessea umbonata]
MASKNILFVTGFLSETPFISRFSSLISLRRHSLIAASVSLALRYFALVQRLSLMMRTGDCRYKEKSKTI